MPKRFLRFLKLLVAGKHRWSRCWMGFHDWDFPGGHCRRCQKCDEFFLPHEICRQEKIQCPGLPNENGLCLVCCNKAWPNAEHHPRCPNRP